MDHRTTRLVIATLAISALTIARPPLARGLPGVEYRPPVDAPVSEPFVAPTGPYGPGHRGIEYATPAGAAVHTAAPGRVAFAGVVAGSAYVTVEHADGLRSTVGPLLDLAVAAGEVVAAGDVLGTASGALLFTVRRGDEYLDPARLLSTGGPPRVHLVAGRADPAAPRAPVAPPSTDGQVPSLVVRFEATVPAVLAAIGFG